MGATSKTMLLSLACHLGEVDDVADVGPLNESMMALPHNEPGADDGQDWEIVRSLVAIRPPQVPNTDTKLLARASRTEG